MILDGRKIFVIRNLEMEKVVVGVESVKFKYGNEQLDKVRKSRCPPGLGKKRRQYYKYNIVPVRTG